MTGIPINFNSNGSLLQIFWGIVQIVYVMTKTTLLVVLFFHWCIVKKKLHNGG